ncbi:uncharacterized protein LOC144704626 [Wolffia australiana]
MEKSKPGRKSHSSTADLLTWTENPIDQSREGVLPLMPGIISHQPSAGMSAALFGGQMTEEEAGSLTKLKPCSTSKLRELTGSGIFTGEQENGSSEVDESLTPTNRPASRHYLKGGGMVSQISFSGEENVSPRKPAMLPEMAKQRELSGSVASETDSAQLKKQLSLAKSKELTGHNILFPSPEEEILPPSPAPDSVREVLSGLVLGEEPAAKTAKKISGRKFEEVSGGHVFNGGGEAAGEKTLSVAKLREIKGCDIFADEKVASREYYGGVRKPPGGESSIALV